MTNKRFKTSKAAFSITELVVVIATIAILFVALVPRIDKTADKAKVSSVQADFRVFYKAAQSVAMEYPTIATFSEEEFQAALNNSIDKDYRFENCQSVKLDPWGDPYRFGIATINNKFCVIFASNGDEDKHRFKTNDMATVVDASEGEGEGEGDDEGESGEIVKEFVPRITLAFAIIDGDIFSLESEEHDIIETYVSNQEMPTTGSLENITVIEGQDFTFKVKLGANEPIEDLSFKWYRSGELVLGENSSTLTMTADHQFDQDKFVCEITKNGKVYKTNTATLTVLPDGIVDLIIKTMPVKTTYSEGQNFDSTGLVLEAVYKSGFNQLINDYTVLNGLNLTGDKTFVEVEWGGRKVPVPISVESTSVIGLKILQLPKQINYVETFDLNTSGLIVALEYNNGAVKTITDYTISGHNKLKPGTQTITISYEGYTINFKVNVTKLQVTKLEVIKKPTKTRYFKGRNFETAGMEIKATWNDGTSKTVANTTGTTSPNGPGYTPITNGYTITNGTALKEGQTSVILKMDNATVSVPIEVYTHEHSGQPGQNSPNGCYTLPVESGGSCSGYKVKTTSHHCSCGKAWPCNGADSSVVHEEVYEDVTVTKYHDSKSTCNEWVPTYIYYLNCGYPAEP